MNHLNRNALKHIPGMRNKENKPATICFAYFSNKIIQITKLPNGNQLPETLLKKHDACSNDYASPSKPLVLDIWVLKYQNIIRKTKRSEKTKRSVPPRKTKRSFSRPPITQNASDFSGAFSVYSSLHFRHSSRTSHSHRHQAATLCAPSYSRICVRFQGLTLCSSAAGLSAVP